MEYIIKETTIETEEIKREIRIVTLSNLNLKNTSTNDFNDLLIRINDCLYTRSISEKDIPTYIFILGNITNLNYLDDEHFKKRLKIFFKELAVIGKTFAVLGNHDFLKNEEGKKYLEALEKVINIYEKCGINIICNNSIIDEYLQIVGFIQYPQYNIDTTRENIKNLLAKTKNNLQKGIINILISHYQLKNLRINDYLFPPFNLVLTGQTNHWPKIISKFIKSKYIIEPVKHEQIIETGDTCNGEIGFIRIVPNKKEKVKTYKALNI